MCINKRQEEKWRKRWNTIFMRNIDDSFGILDKNTKHNAINVANAVRFVIEMSTNLLFKFLYIFFLLLVVWIRLLWKFIVYHWIVTCSSNNAITIARELVNGVHGLFFWCGFCFLVAEKSSSNMKCMFLLCRISFCYAFVWDEDVLEGERKQRREESVKRTFFFARNIFNNRIAVLSDVCDHQVTCRIQVNDVTKSRSIIYFFAFGMGFSVTDSIYLKFFKIDSI